MTMYLGALMKVVQNRLFHYKNYNPNTGGQVHWGELEIHANAGMTRTQYVLNTLLLQPTSLH